jgi:hypothetical protein
VTIYSLPDGGVTNVDPTDDEVTPPSAVPAPDAEMEEQAEPLDTGAFSHDAIPLNPRGEIVVLDGPPVLAAHVEALARIRAAAEQYAADAAAALAAEQRQQYRSQFTAQQLEAADLLGFDPSEILSSEMLGDAVRIVTTRGIYENDGRGWGVPAPLSTSSTDGPYGLQLHLVDVEDLTNVERTELDRWFPPHHPSERAQIFRTDEGLVVENANGGKGARTLLPGDSGRVRPVALMWEQDRPRIRYTQNDGGTLVREELAPSDSIWSGPGSCLDVPPATTPTQTTRAIDDAERPVMEATRDVARAVLDAAAIATDLRTALGTIYVEWERANGIGANLTLIGDPVIRGLLPMLDELGRADQSGGSIAGLWRNELDAANALLDAPNSSDELSVASAPDISRPRAKARWRR